MIIRPEAAADAAAIRALTDAAFAGAPHSDGTEGAIVDRLRAENALSLSLVAETGREIVGHVAFSPVTVGNAAGWYGLGPVSVRPDLQGTGIGSAMIRDGLDRLRAVGAPGCVVLGDPGYYGRFGFVPQNGLTFGGKASPYFNALPFGAEPPSGDAVYHAAFYG
ncbi:GNAT family N-acetyltransferase [Pseudooceanicola sp. LIPI14-2-Ac024]|uniref:GNAT family N-acetyltransferase n=1 Tax=Pseudooceanicola sp. LIPI14-2-Ac024 TaxID=3344875 RepID=UPI0035D04AD9